MALSTVSTNYNRLLSVLPSNEYYELQNNLECVKMRRGEILYKSGEPIKYVYFPENCIISMITVFDDGTSVESGIVGSEGMTGAGIVLSNTNNSRETFVQTSGRSWRMKTDKFRKALDESSSLQKFALNYASAFFEQVAQAGACSNHHSLTQRLSRLLLMCHDRIAGNFINITHEYIAQMLGAYRPNVTNAAIHLKEKKLIDYQRGSIKILDKSGLESTACECYGVINECYRYYLTSLEIRSLNQRAESAHRAMEVEMKRRNEIIKETNHQRQNLKNAMAQIKTLRGEYVLCSNCHRICDENGFWRDLDSFIQKRFNVTINYSVCPNCARDDVYRYKETYFSNHLADKH